jgi:hypothetical protein
VCEALSGGSDEHVGELKSVDLVVGAEVDERGIIAVPSEQHSQVIVDAERPAPS